MKKTTVVHFGCGPIGCSVVRHVCQRVDIELVGAVDIDKSLVGCDLGEVAGIKNKLGVSISTDACAVLSQAKPDVVFLATRSSLKVIYPQVEKCVAAGVRQVGRGIHAGEELVTLESEATVGATESYDAVYLTGTPNLEVVIKGGTYGDIATAAMVVNSVHRVIEAPSGLMTMKDLPMVSALGLNT